MKCPSCKLPLDIRERRPITLPECGHNLCLICTESQPLPSELRCFECGQRSKIPESGHWQINHSLLAALGSDVRVKKIKRSVLEKQKRKSSPKEGVRKKRSQGSVRWSLFWRTF